MLIGNQTWLFENKPVIVSTGTVAGPLEAEGNLREDIDHFYDDVWLDQPSFEQAQTILMEDASKIAIQKSGLSQESMQFFISGDLINQITPTTFAAKTLGLPYFGLFSACATSMESLALSAMIINGGGADYILSGISSHHAATEKQFRYPTEYGGQSPSTAQWTVTGAGCAVVGKLGKGPKITSATIGNVVDLGITDPFNMGEAMAPAAVDTIIAHLNDRRILPNYYDLIITGDLGKIGRQTALQLLEDNDIQLPEQQFLDCGVLIYTDEQPVLAGGSGAACSAVVLYSHIFRLLQSGVVRRVLIAATGSLHSPLSIQQKKSIPTIAHAVSIEME